MYSQKRIFDIIFSIIALICMSPVLITIAILILFSDGWPFIYSQERVGRHNKIFVIYKFKTLRTKLANKDSSHVETKDDYRIFYFGRILRSTHMNELPQFINVLKGDMSVVGPRPMFRGQRNKMLEVPPGITGLAKIEMEVNDRNLKINKNELRYDDFYMKKQSFLLDVYIAVRTIPVILHFKGI